ncbi:ATP synthase subunit s, mitochondrial [Diachasma alloeum]|uniref:ATP synthase subunit s, mitochondrial n=1 Tax=Diachasma alloeum TaxID=454923 RepID=UPI0007384207|nr:ATP synthase subunit s, mitochondrial [Diachasma alloeum]XP_015120939.1 ATP synthase subunit s, mitochondrial [Diachasma alloeum]
MLKLKNQYTTLKRPLFYWLVAVFNRVDEKRIKELGPDRACAEWLLRNGAAVQWTGGRAYLKDYNALPQETKVVRPSYIQGVDGTNSGISHEGFPHFSGCKYVLEMKLVNCVYIGNNALDLLYLLKDSLQSLEISNCGNVTDAGLKHLKILQKLKMLKLSNLPAVENGVLVTEELKKSLPNCQINFQ